MTTAIHDHRPLRVLRNLTLFAVLLALLFVAVEMALVPVVNRMLDRGNADYVVRIADVDFEPWRGAYSVDGLTVHSRGDVDGVAVLEVPRIDAAIDGEALLKGSFVGAITLVSPTARFESPAAGPTSRSGIDMSVATLLGEMLPMPINRLVIDDGAVSFASDVALPLGQPQRLDLRVVDIELTAENLANSDQLTHPLFGSVLVTGKAEGWGALRASMQVAPGAAQPTFDLDAALTGLPLPALNAWSSAVRGGGGVTFVGGTLDIVAEVAASDGRFRGVVKPLAHDVEVAALHRELGSALVANLVKGAAEVLTLPTGERPALRLPFEGEFSDDTFAIVTALLTAFLNALAEAVRPVVDGTGVGSLGSAPLEMGALDDI